MHMNSFYKLKNMHNVRNLIKPTHSPKLDLHIQSLLFNSVDLHVNNNDIVANLGWYWLHTPEYCLAIYKRITTMFSLFDSLLLLVYDLAFPIFSWGLSFYILI